MAVYVRSPRVDVQQLHGSSDSRHGVEGFRTSFRLDQSPTAISSTRRDGALQWAHRLPDANLEKGGRPGLVSRRCILSDFITVLDAL